jgi:hypothetical protein
MNWIIILLCLLAHAFRNAQVISRIALPSFSIPSWNFFRDMGDAPTLSLATNGENGTVSGTVEGSSDTIWPNNLGATIQAEFRHDFAISSADLATGAEHEFRVDVAVNGIFKHKVSSYASPGLHLGPDPTDAFTRSEVFTLIQVREVGNNVPIESDFFNHHLGGAEEDDQNGPVVGGLQQLEPEFISIAVNERLVLPFLPSGNANLSVRVSLFVRTRANGASAESLIAGVANGEGWNDPVSGDMTTTVSNAQFRAVPDPDGPCGFLAPSDE